MIEKHQYLMAKLGEWLGCKGYGRIKPVAGADSSFCESDGLFSKPDAVPLVVEARIMNFYRSQEFRALVGDAILRRHHGESEVDGKRDFLLAVMMKRLSLLAQKDLQAYAQQYMPGLNWYIMDESGNGYACINGNNEQLSIQDVFRQGVHDHSPPPSQGSVFSPGNQCLFKILLLAGIDRRYWGGPDLLPGSIGELAEVSKVSQPSVSSFVMKAEKAGFLKRSRSGFHILRHRDLLDEWFYAVKQRRQGDIGLRFLYGDEAPENLVEKIRKYCQRGSEDGKVPPLVVGHHLACHLMDVGRSNVRFAKIYANRPVEEIISALDLVRDESSAPQLSLVVPPIGQAVLAGHVMCGGIPVCDILQCYLDVRSSLARGSEQAEFILKKILIPHFERPPC